MHVNALLHITYTRGRENRAKSAAESASVEKVISKPDCEGYSFSASKSVRDITEADYYKLTNEDNFDDIRSPLR